LLIKVNTDKQRKKRHIYYKIKRIRIMHSGFTHTHTHTHTHTL